MTLDVKIITKLDNLAKLVSDMGDHEALCLVNNLKIVPEQPFLKAEYVRYYFKAKHDYKTNSNNPDETLHPKGYGHGV